MKIPSHLKKMRWIYKINSVVFGLQFYDKPY